MGRHRIGMHGGISSCSAFADLGGCQPWASIGRIIILCLCVASLNAQLSPVDELYKPIAPQGCPVASSILVSEPRNIIFSADSQNKMFILPLGSLANRIAAVASAATLARRLDANLTVVWPPGGDGDFEASWEDLYQAPNLPIGSFPSGQYSYSDPGCTAHRVSSYEEYRKIQNEWEESSGMHVLCLVAEGFFLSEARHANWFYRLLKPSQTVMDLASSLAEGHYWDRWGQWIGIHACRARECVAEAAAFGSPLPQTADFLAVADQFAHMPLDGESVPRYFIVSEDALEGSVLQRDIWGMNLTGGQGSVLLMPSEARRRHPHSVEGLQESTAALHLLSRVALIIGTPGSKFSAAAAAIGETYMVLAGANVGSRKSIPLLDGRSIATSASLSAG